MRPFLFLLAAATLVVLGLAPRRPASAIPLFARQYRFTCQVCHSVVPRLNAFGDAFLANGERIPGVKPGRTFPLAVKISPLYSSEGAGTGLPRAIVDEVEAFSAGAIGARASYLVEQYVVDGGKPGLVRDAWIQDRINPWGARIPVYAQAGSFTLPLPVDPETFRDTVQHYAVFDQTVGSNPFTFFDPKIGALISIGDKMHGLNGQFFAGPGHDRQSGLPSSGTDWMGYVQHAMGAFSLSFYRYEGTRPAQTGVLDHFTRTGYAAVYNDETRWELDAVLHGGWDSGCTLASFTGCASGGGFVQARYIFGKRFFAVGRYEGTSDSRGTFGRDAVFLLGYGPTKNSRLSIEDVIVHVPQTMHIMNLHAVVAY